MFQLLAKMEKWFKSKQLLLNTSLVDYQIFQKVFCFNNISSSYCWWELKLIEFVEKCINRLVKERVFVIISLLNVCTLLLCIILLQCDIPILKYHLGKHHCIKFWIFKRDLLEFQLVQIIIVFMLLCLRIYRFLQIFLYKIYVS